MSQLNYPHSTTSIIMPNSDSESLDYFLNIPKSSTKDLRFVYALLISRRATPMLAALYPFVIVSNSKYDSHCCTIFLLNPQTSLQTVKAFTESFYLLLFQFYLKENSPKCKNIFSGFCESCFGFHITKIIHHSYTHFLQFSIQSIGIQTLKRGVRD